MMFDTLRFATLTLTALLMGTTFGHFLEMPAKMKVDAPLWLTFQHTLYHSFATVGGVIEIAAIIAATALAYWLRGSTPRPST